MNQVQRNEILSDIWWLSPEERATYVYIDLFHQAPYSDEPNTDKDPSSCPMRSDGRHTLDYIGHRRSVRKNINIFRSLALYDSDRSDGNTIVGPLLLDIDRINATNGGYIPDIDKALEDVRLLVKTCCASLEDKDYRIFFTGHKGFHIEISPNRLNILQDANTLSNFGKIRKRINTRLGDSFIEVLHNQIRLHNSINSWVDYSGNETYSMIFEITKADLHSLTATDICAKGKELAHNAIGF